jgi:hypothetical protein
VNSIHSEMILLSLEEIRRVGVDWIHVDQYSDQVRGLKTALFWDAESWSLVEVNRRFRGAYFTHHQ